MKSWLSLVLIFICSVAYAHNNNGRIKGTLRFKNGKPVSHAIVYIQKLQKYAVSNEEGRYEIEQVPFGKHIIETKTIEADPLELTVEVNKEIVDLPIVLSENSEFNLEDVVVWGKSEMKKLKDQGFAVGLIDTKKLEFQSIQTTELLDRTAGVRIRQSGGMGSDVQYNINGLTGNSIRIFIDGIPIRNYGSSFSLSSIPPAMIERIEVYKGVVPAHLSEDALGGAINVILKKSARNSLSTSYSYGSFNTHRWDMNGSYRDDKTGFTVGGSLFYNYTDNNYKVWGDQIYVSDSMGEMTYVKVKRFHDSYRSMGVNAHAGFRDVKWADQFLVGFLFSDMHKDIQHGATMHIVYGNRASEQSTQMVNLKYEKNDIIKGLHANVFASFSNTNRMVIDTIPSQYNWYGQIKKKSTGEEVEWSKGGGESSQATLAENKEKMLAGRANLAYHFNANHKVSAHYLLNRFTRDIDDPLMPQAQRELTDTRYLTKNILGVTYENSLFDDRFKSSIFYKYYVQNVRLKDFKIVNKEVLADEHDKTMNTSGYGLALSYEIFPRFLLLTSAEKALRLPEGTELLGNTSENVVSSYDLKPESSYNLNLGFNAGPFIWNKHKIGVDVNFFYRDIRDMISRSVSNSNDDTYGYENLGKVMSKGVDMELLYDYNDKITFTSNLSNFNARFNLQYDEHGTEYVYYKNRLRNAPFFTWNNNLEYKARNVFQKGSVLSFIYNLSYVHEFYRNWENLGSQGKDMIPTQAVHDITITYTFPKHKLVLSLDAKNISDEQVFDNWALQKPGRAFYAKISYKIF